MRRPLNKILYKIVILGKKENIIRFLSSGINARDVKEKLKCTQTVCDKIESSSINIAIKKDDEIVPIIYVPKRLQDEVIFGREIVELISIMPVMCNKNMFNIIAKEFALKFEIEVLVTNEKQFSCFQNFYFTISKNSSVSLTNFINFYKESKKELIKETVFTFLESYLNTNFNSLEDHFYFELRRMFCKISSNYEEIAEHTTFYCIDLVYKLAKRMSKLSYRKLSNIFVSEQVSSSLLTFDQLKDRYKEFLMLEKKITKIIVSKLDHDELNICMNI